MISECPPVPDLYTFSPPICGGCAREVVGAPKTNRTSDLPLRRGLLYPLSYRGVSAYSSVKYPPVSPLFSKGIND